MLLCDKLLIKYTLNLPTNILGECLQSMGILLGYTGISHKFSNIISIVLKNVSIED